jgi:hypothetical protein
VRNAGLGAFGEGVPLAWVSVGLRREEAIPHSPGLQPRGMGVARTALPVRRSFRECGTKEEKWRPTECR